MTKVEFIDLPAQYQSIKPAINAAMAAVVFTGGFVLGKAVANFEQVAREVLSLPIYPKMNEEQQDAVIAAVKG